MAFIDHIIIKVNDVEESAAFYRDVLGFSVQGRDGPFTVLRVNADFQIQLAPYGTGGMEHYAFALSRREFDDVLARIVAARIPCGPTFDSVGRREGIGSEVGARGAAPTVYFNDPNNHLLEVRTYDV